MKLVDARIVGFRSLKDARLERLDVVNALVGRNNSGKTALLESLMLLAALPSGKGYFASASACLPWRRDVDEILSDARWNKIQTAPIEMFLSFETTRSDMRLVFDDWPKERPAPKLTYKLELAGDVRRGIAERPIPTSVILHDGPHNRDLLSVINIQGDSVNYRAAKRAQAFAVIQAGSPQAAPTLNTGVPLSGLVDTVLDQPLDNLASLVPLLEWATRLRFVGRTRESLSSVEVGESELLAADGSNLARFLQHLLNNQPLRWAELKAIFQKIIPSVSDIFLPIDGSATSTRVAVTADQDAESAFPLDSMGSGTTHLATIISMVWSTPPGGTCLVEEPEQGLHSGAQRELAFWLRSHALANEKQLVIATHSQVFARPTDSTSIFLARYSPDAGTSFKKLESDEAPLINESLGSRLADFYAFDVLFFIEGESEQLAIPLLAHALGIDLADLGVRLVPLWGDTATRLQRLKEYLHYMTASQVLPFVVMDADHGVPKRIAELVSEDLLDSNSWYLWRRGSKGGEFEDNFSDEQLVAAANHVATAAVKNAKPLTMADLAKIRKAKPSLKTSKALAELYYQRYKYSMPKLDVVARLAQMGADDIAAGNRDYQFVKVFEKLRRLAITRDPSVGRS